jgi:hypothetical protein
MESVKEREGEGGGGKEAQCSVYVWTLRGRGGGSLVFLHHHASLLNSSIKQVNCVGGMAGIEPTPSKSNDWTPRLPCQLGQVPSHLVGEGERLMMIFSRWQRLYHQLYVGGAEEGPGWFIENGQSMIVSPFLFPRLPVPDLHCCGHSRLDKHTFF